MKINDLEFNETLTQQEQECIFGSAFGGALTLNPAGAALGASFGGLLGLAADYTDKFADNPTRIPDYDARSAAAASAGILGGASLADG